MIYHAVNNSTLVCTVVYELPVKCIMYDDVFCFLACHVGNYADTFFFFFLFWPVSAHKQLWPVTVCTIRNSSLLRVTPGHERWRTMAPDQSSQ